VAWRPFKLIWLFAWEPDPKRRAGWSETYYLWAAGRRAAEGVAASLRAARLNTLIASPTLSLAYQRLAEVTPPYLLRLDEINLLGTYAGDPKVKPTLAAPWDGYEVLYRSTTGRHRNFQHRGSPVGEAPSWNLPLTRGNWFSAWQSFLQALIANRASLQIQQNAAAPVPVAALAADQAAQGNVIASVPGHGLPVGTFQLVTFTKCRSRPTLTGLHKVLVLDAGTVQVYGTNLGRISYPGGGLMTPVSYDYDPIASALITRAGLREIHRPFKLASWTTADPAAPIGMHPCGLGMDCLTSCCTVNMRLGAGQDPTPMRWFFCPPGVKPLEGWHAFGSEIWDGNWRLGWDQGFIGEIPGESRPWDAGQPGANWGYVSPCGPEEYFETGEAPDFIPLARTWQGVPLACGAPPPPPQPCQCGALSVPGQQTLYLCLQNVHNCQVLDGLSVPLTQVAGGCTWTTAAASGSGSGQLAVECGGFTWPIRITLQCGIEFTTELFWVLKVELKDPVGGVAFTLAGYGGAMSSSSDPFGMTFQIQFPSPDFTLGCLCFEPLVPFGEVIATVTAAPAPCPAGNNGQSYSCQYSSAYGTPPCGAYAGAYDSAYSVAED
jgi:hypothetical protein